MLRIQHGYKNREKEYDRKNERKSEGVTISGTRVLGPTEYVTENTEREREREQGENTLERSEVRSLTHGRVHQK